MTQNKPPSLPDFWGFLQQTLARLDVDAAMVTSDAQMQALRIKWFDEQVGVLKRIQSDPLYSLAKPNAQRVFREMIQTRFYQIEIAWKDIWRTLYESEAPHDSNQR